MSKRRCPEERVGEKINKLYVKHCYRDKNNNNIKRFFCICECGTMTTPVAHKVVTGRTVSCGCYGKQRRLESRTTHGKSYDPIYSVWSAMKERCLNKKHPSYHRYGGRGITLCEEWLLFNNFYEDMRSGYKKGLELDRINNDKGYFKDNCRWITARENTWNKFHSRGSSKYTGVYWHQQTRKWVARVGEEHIGLFKSEKEAAIAYDTRC